MGAWVGLRVLVWPKVQGLLGSTIPKPKTLNFEPEA